MLSFFRSLRGKLILTYTLVTVLALLALEVMVMILVVIAGSLTNSDLAPYLQDVVDMLPSQARPYLQPGNVDTSGLQDWLEQTYTGGKASMDAQGLFDSPAAIIVMGQPMYVLSPDKVVLAQAPSTPNSLVGRQYSWPYSQDGLTALDQALDGTNNAGLLSARTPQGNYLMAVPVRKDAILQSADPRENTVVGVVILTVKPPPRALWVYWPFLLVGVLVTAVLLLMGVAPFGAVFGFIMSRGLTRRLKALTAAADAWSEGEFSLLPQDRSQDEIGYLGMRMRRMVERIQGLLQSQHELAMMEERNRLARELHDTVKQQNFATLMQVRAAKNLLEQEPAQARQRLDEAEELIRTSQQELGLMIAELRPAAFEGQGLAKFLKDYLGTWSQHASIPAEFSVQNERRLPLDTELALYRVAQEALANIARHSRASAAEVRLTFTGDQVTLAIRDNGVGFDPSACANGGFGLHSMRERMTSLDGWIKVQSSSETGTLLTATAPIQKE